MVPNVLTFDNVTCSPTCLCKGLNESNSATSQRARRHLDDGGACCDDCCKKFCLFLSHSVSTHHRHFTSRMSSTGSLRHYFQIELIRQQELLTCCADPASTNIVVLKRGRNKLSKIVENINKYKYVEEFVEAMWRISGFAISMPHSGTLIDTFECTGLVASGAHCIGAHLRIGLQTLIGWFEVCRTSSLSVLEARQTREWFILSRWSVFPSFERQGSIRWLIARYASFSIQIECGWLESVTRTWRISDGWNGMCYPTLRLWFILT